MAKIQSWEVSDSFWEKIEPLIPEPQRDPSKTYKRKAGGGRKPMPPRKIFEAIMYVLRTGCQWKALPKERFGSPSAIHTHFLRWMRAGFFVTIWRAGLARIRRNGGCRLELAEHRWGHGQGPAGPTSRWSQPDRQGEKKEPSDIYWWTAVVSRYRSS